MDEIGEQLEGLAAIGCSPSIYRRGEKWRFHVNANGNYWADNKDLLKAIKRARWLWERNGCPMDGMAA